MIRTRFAPSPTGFLHLGGARTALFSWAFARHQGADSKFVLRIEDTDLERSSQEAVNAILQAFDWLGLQYDEGPFYQTQHFSRYQQVAQMLLAAGYAYYCYCSKEELDVLRDQQIANKQKPKYSGKCRYHQSSLHSNSFHDHPVIRFKNPQQGDVSWVDLVKGAISINNSELDDLIIVRSDGSPTYNFCVVVDDMDMNISHVIRGDDHVNNTPRQINILKALEQILGQNNIVPSYAHIPMILDANGEKMSKRKDAVDVMQYKHMGILPEALLNYLARLCWAHGDDELFSIEQFISWFDLSHISCSAARFDLQKLIWVNSEKIKQASAEYLYSHMADIDACEFSAKWKTLENKAKSLHIIAAIKHRHETLLSLAKELEMFYVPVPMSDEDRVAFINEVSLELLKTFIDQLAKIHTPQSWTIEEIKLLIKSFCFEHNIKMPQIAMPIRLILCGQTHTVSVDVLLYLIGYDTIKQRVEQFAEVNKR
jgi:glutamyl-tRNA synthetase